MTLKERDLNVTHPFPAKCTMKLEEKSPRDLCSMVVSHPRMHEHAYTGNSAQQPESRFPLSHEHSRLMRHKSNERDQRPGDK